MRAAVADDVPAIMEVERTSFEHAGERFGQPRVEYLIASPRAQVFVAESEGRVVGWAAGFVWLRGKEPWGRLYALAVDPSVRGKKVGARLMHHMLNTLKLLGAGRIFLEVRPDNDSAIRLYEKSGFAPCRLLHDYYGPGRPAQRMARPA